jgi:hypothetical protein
MYNEQWGALRGEIENLGPKPIIVARSMPCKEVVKKPIRTPSLKEAFLVITTLIVR